MSACSAPVQGLKKTAMDLRTPEKGRDLIVRTQQAFCSVFVGGAFMGATGAKKVLRVSNVAAGGHALRLVCMPDFDFGPEQVMEIPVTIAAGAEPADITVNVLRQRVLASENIRSGFNKKKRNPFAQLDMETDDF